mmetsp:Transcript_13839/g.39861  ORF Transcript_13839/g.39861 Transcript_13839/m.39861 type:complete len:236 (+) Transcript_13839:102-809(+)
MDSPHSGRHVSQQNASALPRRVGILRCTIGNYHLFLLSNYAHCEAKGVQWHHRGLRPDLLGDDHSYGGVLGGISEEQEKSHIHCPDGLHPTGNYGCCKRLGPRFFQERGESLNRRREGTGGIRVSVMLSALDGLGHRNYKKDDRWSPTAQLSCHLLRRTRLPSRAPYHASRDGESQQQDRVLSVIRPLRSPRRPGSALRRRPSIQPPSLIRVSPSLIHPAPINEENSRDTGREHH